MRDEATVMPEAVSAAPAAAVGATEKIKPDSVESEVTELMRLHKSGDSKQLRMKLREFVVNHPDYILPKDLQPVLQSESNK